jgi:hypothetical protein
MTEIGLHKRLESGAILYVGKDTEDEDYYTIIVLDGKGEIHEISLSLDFMDIVHDLVAALWTTPDEELSPIPEELAPDEET